MVGIGGGFWGWLCFVVDLVMIVMSTELCTVMPVPYCLWYIYDCQLQQVLSVDFTQVA